MRTSTRPMPSGASAQPETWSAVPTIASSTGASIEPIVTGGGSGAGVGSGAGAGADGDSRSCCHATVAAMAIAPTISAPAATRWLVRLCQGCEGRVATSELLSAVTFASLLRSIVRHCSRATRPARCGHLQVAPHGVIWYGETPEFDPLPGCLAAKLQLLLGRYDDANCRM